MTDYTSVKVPKRLAMIIEESTLFQAWGYRSVSEFILDSVRRRLEDDQLKVNFKT